MPSLDLTKEDVQAIIEHIRVELGVARQQFVLDESTKGFEGITALCEDLGKLRPEIQAGVDVTASMKKIAAKFKLRSWDG